MTRNEFKDQIIKMTKAQKQKWFDIHTRLLSEVNEKEFKTRADYKKEMSKIYDKTIEEYCKSES